MSLLVPVKYQSNFPWAGLSDLERQLERLFHPETVSGLSAAGTWVPPVDIHETETAFVLEADLPGMTKDDISVSILEDRITLRGTRKRESRHEEKGYRRYERPEGTFERSFRISGIDPAVVDARFENGVLTVTLPKPEEAKPRRIEVHAS